MRFKILMNKGFCLVEDNKHDTITPCSTTFSGIEDQYRHVGILFAIKLFAAVEEDANKLIIERSQCNQSLFIFDMRIVLELEDSLDEGLEIRNNRSCVFLCFKRMSALKIKVNGV